MKVVILLGGLSIGLLAVLVLTELVLRFGLGFGHPPLYVADETMGYRLAPNQKVKRLGNRIEINKYSMRAGAIAPAPPPNTLRVFLLGDSLANGNWWTDQDDILSTAIAKSIEPNLPEAYSDIEALNASANSWGPRNELAYLERYGTFKAQVLVLLLNTDDLFGTEPTSLQVGRDRSYPNRNYSFALTEIFSRLFKKNQPIPGLKEIQNEGGDRVGKNLTAIHGIYQRATAANGKLIVVLSPLKRELTGPKDYELTARQRLQDWATQNNVIYLDLLPDFQAHPNAGEALYRDHIHLSPAGNAKVSQLIADTISLP
ncbi:MAG: SGNH/GDSL hydrolase family protein [Phormidesmis sp.]